MESKEILELVSAALEIQKKGRGINGFPCINVTANNYIGFLTITVQDSGFEFDSPYDGEYDFPLNGPVSARQLRACKEHLKELAECVEGFER